MAAVLRSLIYYTARDAHQFFNFFSLVIVALFSPALLKDDWEFEFLYISVVQCDFFKGVSHDDLICICVVK